MVVLILVAGVGVGVRGGSLVVAMAASVSLLILTVRAVPTLLSCLAFIASFSPRFLVSSFPFYSLFVSLSLCISVASLCSSPSHGSSSRRRDEKEKKTSLGICHRKISPSEISAVQTRSWWCCRHAPHGYDLTWMYLSLSILLLFLCMPCSANARTEGVQPDINQHLGLPSSCDPLVYGSKNDPSCQGITAVTPLEDSAEAGILGGAGALKKLNDRVVPEFDIEIKKTNKLSEEHESHQTRSVSSLGINSNGLGLPAQELSTLIASSSSNEELGVENSEQVPVRFDRAGGVGLCGSTFPVQAARAATSEFLLSSDSSNALQALKSSPSPTPSGATIVPSQVQWGQQRLFQPIQAQLTIINTCNSSAIEVHSIRSDNWQFSTLQFKENAIAPGGQLKLHVAFLPQSVGAVEGVLTVDTSEGRFTIQMQGEGIVSPYKLELKQTVDDTNFRLSLFNPHDNTLNVDDIFPWLEDKTGFLGGTIMNVEGDTDNSSGESVEDKSDTGKHEESSSRLETKLQAIGDWEIEPQTSQDILELQFTSDEDYKGTLCIRLSGVPSENGVETLVFPVSLQASPVLAVPTCMDFGVLVGGDQPRTQPLILLSSGDQSVQIEEIYDGCGDQNVLIEYTKGRILIPYVETEVAKITYRGSSPCGAGQKIMVHVNSTRIRPIEVPYRAQLLQGLGFHISPPAMAFVTESTGLAAGDLNLGKSTDSAQGGQGMDKGTYLSARFRKIQLVADLSSQMLDGGLLTEYGKLFLGFLLFALLVGVLVFFRMFVHDTVLPTLSGEQVKSGSHRKSSSWMSLLLGSRCRDRWSKIWGVGALECVGEGLKALILSSLGRKDCVKSSSQLTLPHIRVVGLPQTTKSSGGVGVSSTKQPAAHQGGRKGSADRKHNGVSRHDQPRTGKAAMEAAEDCLPVSMVEPATSSGRQSRKSKSPKEAVNPATPTILIEASTSDDRDCVQNHTSKAPIAELGLAPGSPNHTSKAPIAELGLAPGSPTADPRKTGTTPFKNLLAQKAQPVSPREKTKRKKKKGQSASKQDSGTHVGANVGTSPASPASPATPASPPRPVSPLSSNTSCSSSSHTLLGHAPLTMPPMTLKVSGAEERDATSALLGNSDAYSLSDCNPAPAFVRPESLSVDVASNALRQMAQAKGADLSWQASPKMDSGTGKRANNNEWVSVARKNVPNSGFAKGDDIEDGCQSYRGINRNHKTGNSRKPLGSNVPALTPSASFPGRTSQGTQRNIPGVERNNPMVITGSPIVPPPVIAPSLRAPGAKITKPCGNNAPANDGWGRSGFTTKPEGTLGDKEKESGSTGTGYPPDTLSGQSSGELMYDIWGNHFGDLSHCSSHLQQNGFLSGLEKEGDPIRGFHRQLVPEHSDSLLGGDMSPTQALFSSFSGFFSDVSPLGLEQSHPSSLATVNDSVGPGNGPPGFADRTSALVTNSGTICQGGPSSGTSLANVKPRVRVPYSPPMSCVSSTPFSPSNTPTAAKALSPHTDGMFCSFWSNSSDNLQERAPSRGPSPM